MILTAFTLFHVALSLAGIGAGFVVLYGWLTSRPSEGWIKTFLTTTVFTSLTGFLFPVHHVTPAHLFGIISLVVLAIAIPLRHSDNWRGTYVSTAVIALYLNCFVLVAQLFLKVPSLKAIAPTQSEPPFVVAQSVLLLAFVILGTLATVRFRRAPSASHA